MTETLPAPEQTLPAPLAALEIRPFAGYIGAEIFGVDLRSPLQPEVVAEIRATLIKWKVVFFRDQHLTQDQHIAFGRQFGEITPGHPTLPAAFPDHPEILLLDNKQFIKREKAGGGSGSGPSIESRWHTDVTFVPNPPMGSILRGVVVPAYGGDTQWTNLAVAYERLSAPLQRLCDELHAVHHNFLPISRGELPGALKKQFQSQDMRSVHPVVRVHPESGEKALFVNPNFTSHIVELSRAEGNHLLAMLYEHIASPTLHLPPPLGGREYRVLGQPGDLPHRPHRRAARRSPLDAADHSRGRPAGRSGRFDLPRARGRNLRLSRLRGEISQGSFCAPAFRRDTPRNPADRRGP